LERECGPLVGLFEQALCAPSITQAEEDRLLWHAQRGARWAIEAIMNNQMRLVFDVAYRCCKQYDACRVPFEDVFSGGLEGLLIAIQKYEIERGHRFASFAWQWVANKAERAFVYSLRPINIPYHVWEKIGRFCRSSNADLFFAEDHSSFSFSADSRMWIEKWGWIMRVLMQSRTLTADSVELELISDENAQTELDLILDSLTVPLVLNGLNHRQTEILLMRHGLHPDALGRGMTLDQIATRLQITRERVRQIELQAINKLRKVSASLDGA
jgi:RNA polymerase sigma factor (sigma-70 family)